MFIYNTNLYDREQLSIQNKLRLRMYVEDAENMKAQERQVKDENFNHSHPKNQQQNLMGEQQNEMMMEINSDASSERQSLYKPQKNQVLQFRPKTVDLSKEILPGIVKHCRSEKLISEDLAHCFLTNFTTKIEKDYIECFKKGRFWLFDFGKCKINIIDHRRLTEMLINHNSNRYLPPKKDAPFDYLKEGKEFLTQIYAMSQQEYQKITTEQVNKHHQTWWGGPENLNPVPPQQKMEIMDVEEAARQAEEMELKEKKRRMEEEQARLMRVTQQRATKEDLADIARKISSQLFGKPTPQVKYEDQMQDEDERRRGRQGKKEKKGKKKSKKKKGEREKEIKKQWIQETKAKKQAGLSESATINKLD